MRDEIIITSNSIRTCRNIAAHDYDSLNWSKVKELCERILSEDTKQRLQKALVIAEGKTQIGKDYRNGR